MRCFVISYYKDSAYGVFPCPVQLKMRFLRIAPTNIGFALMILQSNIYVIYLIFAIVVCSFINIYAWRNPQTRGSRAFMMANFFATIWMSGDIIARLTDAQTGKWIGEFLRYLGVAFLPIAFFCFIYRFSGKRLNAKITALMTVIPVISWLMVLTSPWHTNFFLQTKYVQGMPFAIEYGWYFWTVHLPYCYAILLFGFGTLFLEYNRASRTYRKQTVLLLVAFSIPFIVNIISVFKVFGDGIYTPLSIPASFAVVAYSIFRHRFLDSNPIAYETVFHTIRDGVLILDPNDVIRDINPAAALGLNKKPAEIIGMHVREAFTPWQTAIELYDANPKDLGEIEAFVFGQARYLSIESTPLARKNKISDGRIITIRDITDKHKHQLSLEAMAFHDPLTRLANRRKFQEEVEIAITEAQENGKPLALLYMDMNRFKAVNDTYGHETGDELLKYVAARIASILRKPDVLARLGGDEFALLLHDCDDHGVELVVGRIMDNVKRPFRVGEATLVPDLSIGAAFYPENGKNLTELLRHADAAMYLAKQNGGGIYMQPIAVNASAERLM